MGIASCVHGARKELLFRMKRNTLQKGSANGYHLLMSASAIEKHVDQQPDKKLTDVTYEYSNTNAIDGLPHCITHATVTGTKDGTTLTAANVSYTYGNHMALVKDEISGKTLRYHFNDDGNQVSVDDELGYAMYT